jgi:hypothetical protein
LHVVKFKRMPKGISFGVDELLVGGAWAAENDAWMSILLDYGSDAAEYEEVLIFHLPSSTNLRYWLVWKSPTAISMQASCGRRRRFKSIHSVLKLLSSDLIHSSTKMPIDLGAPHFSGPLSRP